MAAPLVSIIVPCYRQAQFLPATLDRALGQSERDIEVVVVNDGSDDDTAAVAARYGDRVRYHFQPNAGLAAARNTGIGLARGTYLLFLDSDDLLHPDAVSWLLAAAGGRADVLAVMGWQFFVRDDDLTNGFGKLPPHGRPLGPALVLGNFAPPHGYLARRTMVQAVGGFAAAVPGCEDWDLWSRLVFAGAEVVPVYRTGAHYRQHPAAMSRNGALMATAGANVLRRSLAAATADPGRVVAIGADPHDFARQVRQRLAEWLSDAAFHLRQTGEYTSAARHYWRSMVEGEFRPGAVTGLCKLPPHRLFRQFLNTASAPRAVGGAA